MAVKAQVSITISHLIDISSITRYYLLQSSTSAAPAKPTTNPALIGKNLIPYPYNSSSATTDGITFTAKSDGSITISGTSTKTTGATVFFLVANTHPLHLNSGGTYTLSGFSSGAAGCGIKIQTTSFTTTYEINSASKTVSFTSKFPTWYIWVYVDAGKTVNATFKPQLEVGTTATAYQKYVTPNWQLTEPAYTSGSTNTLYFVDCTEFTNGTFKYSEVSKSSSYEAAKEAYNKATAVETRVTNTETAIEQNKEAIELRATKSELTSEIDNVQDAINQQGVALTKTITDYVSAIQTNADSISASVEKLEAKVDDNADDTNAAISELRQKVDLQLTEDAVNIQIDKKLQNGVDRVETSTGFKFDENGLNISKSGSTTNTQITENGMSVKNTETNEDMLTANKDGVDAKNLRASTYLIVGGRSRFENYGSYRTGCFWIGPSSGISYPVTNPAFVIEELTAQNNEIKSALQTISDRLDTIT